MTKIVVEDFDLTPVTGSNMFDAYITVAQAKVRIGPVVMVVWIEQCNGSDQLIIRLPEDRWRGEKGKTQCLPSVWLDAPARQELQQLMVSTFQRTCATSNVSAVSPQSLYA